MIFVIGPCFPFGPLNVLTLLFPWLPNWLLRQHAKLIRKPGERRAQDALAEPPQASGSPRR